MKLHEHFCMCIHAAALVLAILATTTAVAYPQENSLSRGSHGFCTILRRRSLGNEIDQWWAEQIHKPFGTKQRSILGVDGLGKTDGDGNSLKEANMRKCPSAATH